MSKVKPYLFILLTVLAVSFIAGCSDSDDDSGPKVTKPNLSDPSTLQGTYRIDFFYTEAMELVLTTDCSKVAAYLPGKATCADASKDSLQHYGRVTMSVNSDESVKILSKMQMNGEFMKNPVVAQAASGNTYNFNEYRTIPASAITATAINDPETGNEAVGVAGRDATALVSENGANGTTFKFIVEEDGTVVNNMVNKSVSIADANVYIRMTKISDSVEKLDPNTSYNGTAGAPEIDNFSTEEEAKYTLKTDY